MLTLIISIAAQTVYDSPALHRASLHRRNAGGLQGHWNRARTVVKAIYGQTCAEPTFSTAKLGQQILAVYYPAEHHVEFNTVHEVALASSTAGYWVALHEQLHGCDVAYARPPDDNLWLAEAPPPIPSLKGGHLTFDNSAPPAATHALQAPQNELMTPFISDKPWLSTWTIHSSPSATPLQCSTPHRTDPSLPPLCNTLPPTGDHSISAFAIISLSIGSALTATSAVLLGTCAVKSSSH